MLVLQQLGNSQVIEFYHRYLEVDFPEAERKPLSMILHLLDEKRYEPLGFYEGEELKGYAWFQKEGEDYLLDYLSVVAEQRNRGIGSQILEMTREYYHDAHSIIIEIEDPDYAETADDRELQSRRRGFYLRNGLADTGVRVTTFGVPFQLLLMRVGIAAGAEAAQSGEAHTQLAKETTAIYASLYRSVLTKQQYDRKISFN